MKVRIKNWDDAVKAALTDSENWFIEDDSIFGIKREFGDWGEVIEGYKDGTYFCSGNCFSYPLCVVDEIIEDDDGSNPYDVLRYGKIIEEEMLYDNCEFGIARTIRIRLISYNGLVWYHKMSDGTVMECRKVGSADA